MGSAAKRFGNDSSEHGYNASFTVTDAVIEPHDLQKALSSITNDSIQSNHG